MQGPSGCRTVCGCTRHLPVEPALPFQPERRKEQGHCSSSMFWSVEHLFSLTSITVSLPLSYHCITNYPKTSWHKITKQTAHGLYQSGIWRGHGEDGLSLLCNAWDLSWQESTGWGWKMHFQDGFFLHMAGT